MCRRCGEAPPRAAGARRAEGPPWAPGAPSARGSPSARGLPFVDLRALFTIPVHYPSRPLISNSVEPYAAVGGIRLHVLRVGAPDGGPIQFDGLVPGNRPASSGHLTNQF